MYNHDFSKIHVSQMTKSQQPPALTGLSLRGVQLHVQALAHSSSVLGELLIARLNY